MNRNSTVRSSIVVLAALALVALGGCSAYQTAQTGVSTANKGVQTANQGKSLFDRISSLGN